MSCYNWFVNVIIDLLMLLLIVNVIDLLDLIIES